MTVMQRETMSRTAWYGLSVLVVAGALSYVDRQIISLMADTIKGDLGINDFEFGLVQGVAFGLFYAIFGLPMGWLIDRYPRRIIIFGGMMLWSIATAACGVAKSFGALILARFGVGVGEASLYPGAFSMIADMFPPRRLALAVGIFATGAAIGALIAYIGGSILIEHLQARGPVVLPLLGLVRPWQQIFLIVGAPGCLVALLVFTFPEPTRGLSHRALQAGNLLPFLRQHRRFFLCHFLGTGIMATISIGSVAWVPTMLMRVYGMKIGEVGLLLGLTAALLGVIGFVASGWIADRWFACGRRDAHMRYLAIASALGGALTIVAFATRHITSVALPIFCLIHLFQPFTGPAVAQIHLVSPSQYRGRLSALLVLIYNLMGLCIGPPLIGFLTDYVFRDPMKIDRALATANVGLAMIASAIFALGFRSARRALDDMQAEGEPDGSEN